MLQMCSVLSQDYEGQNQSTTTMISVIYKARRYSFEQSQITCSLSDG